jgi:hypothetical protein
MRCLQILILAAALNVAVAAWPVPAAATNKDEALKLCEARGSQCMSFGLGQDPGNDILICVDNRSSGQGVQCVRCQGSAPCSVLRLIPHGKRSGVSEVEAVLTAPTETSSLEERIRILEEQVKALGKGK